MNREGEARTTQHEAICMLGSPFPLIAHAENWEARLRIMAKLLEAADRKPFTRP